ncbi:hypothetical protein PAHAL_7G175600 [Panicum hallii]|jgi:hypothetical protein|uniref:Uncharacterized protein n=1 Tax=Panicum hallii TaxID=206008 RepID=A0A2T8ICN0_9POAL|nr:hypothetical protein PAHAL_7G175600 [Panicum hallii]
MGPLGWTCHVCDARILRETSYVHMAVHRLYHYRILTGSTVLELGKTPFRIKLVRTFISKS